jgi:hypothetical protein
MASKCNQQRAQIQQLENDVAALKVYADANTVTTASIEVVVRINARLDTAFRQCQALLDDVDRFQDPALYYRLLTTYRTLFSVFQKWD